MNRPRYSVVIPVYNRPYEIDELLDSLTRQTFTDFEVLIIEDGSSIRCEHIVDQYRTDLNIRYFYKANSGPGPSRNYGYAAAKGYYFIVFDSDCIIPPNYFSAVNRSLAEHQWDAWGGPDRAHENFTVVQQAMGYTMSSFLTTGGIRGGKKRLGWFQPRSFNMGISRRVFEITQGFRFDRYAEDIEFSIRMKLANFKVGLINDAYVYHKRRTDFKQFFHQVFNFGRGRALIGKAYPAEVKLTHWIPSLFVMGIFVVFVILPWISLMLFGIALAGIMIYLLAIAVDALRQTRNFLVALFSIPSAVLQLSGYGLGFLKERFRLSTLKKRATNIVSLWD